jgi:catechol 2,3-dioxygenase-like lactoylglutathione lyase family enzyme
VSGHIRGYHHVTHNISRSNIAAARRFYGELLGLRELSPMGDPTNRRLIWFALGDRQLHLVIADKADASSSRHLAVIVEEFEAFVQNLHKEGVSFDERETGKYWGERPDGSKFAFCYDPDRNRIELMEAR